MVRVAILHEGNSQKIDNTFDKFDILKTKTKKPIQGRKLNDNTTSHRPKRWKSSTTKQRLNGFSKDI